jgi:hypothetical protein
MNSRCLAFVNFAWVIALATTAVSADGSSLQKKPADKVLTVGKEGIKLKGKLTDEAKNVPYAIRMEAGKTYEIRLASKDFDAYLFVKDDKGKQLDYDDDSGGGTNSLLEFRAPASGVFQIIATSLGMDGAGDYTLHIVRKP